MVVKLSRFVRVMSGGLVVTDELVAVREAKVAAELAKLQAQSDLLVPAGLPVPALAAHLRDLTAARDAALRLGSNKDICTALEVVKFDARDALTEIVPHVDVAVAAAQQRTAKLGEVDAAMAGLGGAEAAIPAGVCKAAIAGLIPALQGRRDLLANAADLAAVQTQMGVAPALLTDIGKVQAAAVAAKLKAERYAQAMSDVTAAMVALRQIETDTVAPFKAQITASIAPLTARADALGAAADLAAVTTQTGLAPALLADIGKAQTKAATAKLNAGQFTARTAAIDQRLTYCDQWIAVLKAGSDGPIKLTRAAVAASRTALDTMALAGLKAAMVAVERAASALYDDTVAEAAKQTKTNADTWPPVFPAWESQIGKISATNPVHAEVVILVQEKANADALTDAAARRAALATFISNAAALQSKIQGMTTANKKIEQVGMTIQALLTLKPMPTPGPVALAQERLNELAKVPAAFAQTTTTLVMTKLAALDLGLLAIKAKAEDWRASQIGLEKQKAGVAKSLAEARVAVDLLATGAGKTDLDDACKALVLRKTAIDGMPEAEANKALFALDKDAISLLERAHKQVFNDQLAAPGGKQKIDDAVKALGDKAADPQAEAKCRAALAARFKLDIKILEGLSVDRLPQLYEMFALVPADHVGHDKLTALEYNTDASLSASYYQGADNKIALWMPGSETDAPYKPQSGAGAVLNLNYFKATTLHEIGHAVDTKQGIMSDSRMAGADFGGWQKESVATVVDAYYTNAFASFVAPTGPKEADLRAFIKAVLETGDCKKPASDTAPLGSLFAKWADLIASDGCKNCKKIRNADLSPWDAPVTVDARAYHEGYGGVWFSYLVASRSKGVSNYQWRAPPEWFAELYAYYHMTKKEVPASVRGFIMGTETAR